MIENHDDLNDGSKEDLIAFHEYCRRMYDLNDKCIRRVICNEMYNRVDALGGNFKGSITSTYVEEENDIKTAKILAKSDSVEPDFD
jgi:hypothetical protein